jgi:hypothetical protein
LIIFIKNQPAEEIFSAYGKHMKEKKIARGLQSFFPRLAKNFSIGAEARNKEHRELHF